MANSHPERVRERAYHLWRESGESGHEMDHWLRAEREIAEADQAPAKPKRAGVATKQPAPKAVAKELAKAPKEPAKAAKSPAKPKAAPAAKPRVASKTAPKGQA